MSARIPDSTLRSCDHPGCEATFDAAGRAEPGWVQVPSRNDHYCPKHHDSPVPAATRRLIDRHGADWRTDLGGLHPDLLWDYEDVRDFLIACPTPSLLWQRALLEALRVMNDEISDQVVFDFLDGGDEEPL